MGVQGLHSLMNRGSRAGKSFQWTRENKAPFIIVDGMGLIYMLFRKSANWQLGGSWPEFEACLMSYLSFLRDVSCDILVVLDGAVTSLKRGTIVKRCEDRIQLANRVLHDIPITDGNVVLPIATCEVCIDILTRHGVQYLLCTGDADCVAAQESLLNNGIIIGQDSDFYIYESCGYAPLDNLYFDELSGAVSGVVLQRSDAAARLHVDLKLLPLVAAFSKNDYTLDLLDTFYSALLQGKSSKRKSQQGVPHILLTVGEYVASHAHLAPAALVGAVLDKMRLSPGSNRRNALATLLLSIINLYQGDPAQAGALPPTITLLPRTLDIAISRTYYCFPLIEDPAAPTVWNVARELLRLLCAFVAGPCPGSSCPPVDLYMREGTSFGAVLQPDDAHGCAKRLDPNMFSNPAAALLCALSSAGMADDGPREHVLALACLRFLVRSAAVPELLAAALVRLVCCTCGAAIGPAESLDCAVVPVATAWQCTVYVAHQLDVVLGSPLPPPSLFRLCDGARVQSVLQSADSPSNCSKECACLQRAMLAMVINP